MREMRASPTTTPPDSLIGEHPSIIEVLRLIERVAASPIRTVLIYGETGTGKGIVARRLHRLSDRARAPFVDLNCAAIPGTLLESELFGHERGAFTGATARKRGLIETADGGTVFLDEIREMDLALQAKLLGVLDTRALRPIGATRQAAVDVRFIAATNQILLGEVKKGLFREDLYYRLQVVAINLPPLRDRGEDVLVLTEHFTKVFAQRYRRRAASLDPAVRDIFSRYAWPGNVRELENLIERFFVLEDGDVIQVRHLPARITREVEKPALAGDGAGSPPPVSPPLLSPLPMPSYWQRTESYQKGLLLDALEASHYRLERAAAALGISRHALRHQLKRLGLEASPPA